MGIRETQGANEPEAHIFHAQRGWQAENDDALEELSGGLMIVTTEDEEVIFESVMTSVLVI